MPRIGRRSAKARQASRAAEAEKKYAEFRAEVYKRELSNAENFDKAILTYASGALAVSLAFLKDFVPIHKAAAVWLLYASWGMFVCCIVSTVASYLFSQAGIKKQLEHARHYYVDGQKEALNARNVPARITEGLNIASGALFCCAIVTTTVFIAINAKAASLPGKKADAQSDGIAPVVVQVAHIAREVEACPDERGTRKPTDRPIRRAAACAGEHAAATDRSAMAYDQSGIADGTESTEDMRMNGKTTISTDGRPMPNLAGGGSVKEMPDAGVPIPHIIPVPAPPPPPPPPPPPAKR